MTDNRALTALVAAVISGLIAIPNLIVLSLRYRDEMSLSRRVERAIKTIAGNETSKFVPFGVIRHHIGGYGDDELRRLLVRAGLVRLSDHNMIEYWVRLRALTKEDKQNLQNVTIPEYKFPPSSSLFPLSKKDA